MSVTRWIATPLAGLLLVLAGCGGGGGDPTAPPSGWNASDDRIWKEGVDTSEVFQDMGSLSEMGVIEEGFTLNSGNITQEQFKSAIKQSLVKLYRTNPTLVDTLFEQHAAPKLEDADLSGSAVKDGKLKPELLNEYKNKAFKAIKDNYKSPTLQEPVENISYPDSLRQNDVTGTVELQMHVDSTGAVNAIEVVQKVHPTLDKIAVVAATRTKWESAYEMVDREWQPRPGWGRSPVPFRLR
jgi:TonB family protein